MKNSKRRISLVWLIGCLILVASGGFGVEAQSTSQSFPTPISTGEIGGKIAARDLGDARLTAYYFVFNANQGDVFVNVKTSNLDADIDVFTADNLRPLMKITVFSDVAANETGRVIYFRKPEKLILRVEGRTPNDQPATFNLKFAGSFAPPSLTTAADEVEPPEVKSNDGEVAATTARRVNSVGTIIETQPKPKPPEIEKSAESEEKAAAIAENNKSEASGKSKSVKKPGKRTKTSAGREKKIAVAAADEEVSTNDRAAETAAEKSAPDKKPNGRRTRKTAKTSTETAGQKSAEAPNPLENVRLSIVFRDGTKIERPMSEVLRVGVDKGVLTLITRNGAIARFSILDVAKMTIE